MSTPSSPLEALQSAARTVFGRMLCFALACCLGGACGYILDYAFQPTPPDSFTKGFLFCATVVPMAFVSFLASYGLIVFPLCLVFAFVFIRCELGIRWLIIPFAMVGCQAWTLEAASW